LYLANVLCAQALDDVVKAFTADARAAAADPSNAALKAKVEDEAAKTKNILEQILNVTKVHIRKCHRKYLEDICLYFFYLCG
jgi:hypothetical protein